MLRMKTGKEGMSWSSGFLFNSPHSLNFSFNKVFI